MEPKLKLWHIFGAQVEFEDIDFGGVVHHSRYFNFIERGRARLFYERGITAQALAEAKVAFTVTNIKAQYLSPLRLYQNIQVVTRIATVSSHSLEFEQFIFLRDLTPSETTAAEIPAGAVFTGTLRLVCISSETGTSTEIPEDFRTKLAGPF